MHSTLKLRDSDPHDDFAIAPDVVPAAWADKVLADIKREAGSAARNPPGFETLISVEQPPATAASGVAVVAPTVDTTFRPTATAEIVAPVEQPSTSRWVKSAIMLVFAICSAAAAVAWQNHGDAAKQVISNWMPAFAVTSSSPPTETAAPGAQADAPVAQAFAAEPPPPEALPLPQQEAALTAAPSQEATQLQSMARDLAAMAQQVEQLKTSIAELKAGQHATARDVARASDARPAESKAAAPNPRPRISPPPPRTAAAPPHRTLPSYPPAQAAPRPPPVTTLSAPPPPQATARSMDEPIVRPPMSLLDR